ncbi:MULTISPECIES: hypothetical protein [Psychrobacter]|uniref:Uncharacterized protein n=1 Tax=Psychrobacter alimentarius TaxID=261164 RepID=A0ABN4N0N1_9GAMM|nr:MULTISPECIES: hypothetical protein [Psychrobacter]AMT96513.1 hypothetical protein A3K91_0898 [Psychrobacter alimentarius]QCB31099.1 hypothetical protein E5677_08885 [Psychrobacter sp. PAMC27889]
MKIFRGFTGSVKFGLNENENLIRPRRPRHSDCFVHEIVDQWFYCKFGIKARSETIFCTPNCHQATKYGEAYEITVPDTIKYKLIYSVKVDDLIDIEEEVDDLKNKDEIIAWLESKDYAVVSNFDKLPIKFRGEIMLYCTHFNIEKDGEK